MKWIMTVIIIGLMTAGATSYDWNRIIINKGFRDKNTYFISCKGYPKDGLTNDTQKKQTARDAALLFAQYYAKEIFDDSVDVVKNGIIESTEYFDDYAVVIYVIEQRGLSHKMRYFDNI